MARCAKPDVGHPITLMASVNVGTSLYMASEPFGDQGYNEKVNILSFTLILYEIFLVA
jgi:serine/threonine protein kinase